MSAPKSSRLQFFAETSELHDWLEAARRKGGLWAVCVRFGGETRALVRPEEGIDQSKKWDRIFLFTGPLDSEFDPPLHNDIDPAARGWVLLNVGTDDQTVLEMSELVYKSDRPAAARIFRLLRSEFVRHLIAGADARGASGQARHYRNVWMSRGAIEQTLEGKTLRQRGVLRVRFEAPARSKSDVTRR